MSNPRIECSNKRCKWTGKEKELLRVPSKDFPDFAFDNKCPKCQCDSYYILPEPVECERVKHINQLIGIISSYGREFFKHENFISFMEKDKNGKVWFTDYYTKRRIYTHYKGDWRGFTSGGTLKNLVERFRDYITKGELISIQLIAPKRFSEDSNIWGYPKECVEEMRVKALELPCIKGAA
ncbi:hypothetical protein [Catenovulum sediminis]|uniref:Uncharacterized protein n=1 Tax=Catenovulum sediminis TaxID=1740262 RepID=A0ABV1RHX3_9ALTE